MQHVSTDSDSAIGFRVWTVAEFDVMKRAHTHPDIEINYVANGFVEYLFGGVKKRVDAGGFAVFWGGIPHQLTRCSPAGRGVWVTLPIADFLRWSLPGQLDTRLIGGEMAQGEGGAQNFRRWCADFVRNDLVHRRVLLLELEAWLYRVGLATPAPGAIFPTQNSSGGAAHIARIAGFLATHYAEDIDLPTIARAAGLNPKYLARIFKTQTRLTVHAYLLRLRLAHAQRLLSSTEMKVADVALQSGFGSLASFYAAFKRWGGGAKPHAYRRRWRERLEIDA